MDPETRKELIEALESSVIDQVKRMQKLIKLI